MRLVVLLATIVCVSSLYEDQVGVNDFHLANIGDVKSASFHADTQRKRVYFSTGANFVGALDSRSGEILWRHSLGASESVDAFAQEGRTLASVSGGGRYLRVWTSAEGSLLWDAQTGAAAGQEVADVKYVGDIDDDEHEDIAVAVGNSVVLFSGAKGKRLWHWQSDDSKLVLSKIVYADAKAGSIKVVGMKVAGSSIDTVVDIAAKLGTSKKGSKALGRSCPSITVMGNYMACLDSSSTLYTWSLHDLSQSSHSLDSLASGVTVDSAVARLDVAAGMDILLVHLSGDACAVVRVTKDKAQVEHTFKGTAAGQFLVAIGADKNGDESVVQVAPGKGGGLEMTMLSLKTKTTKKEMYDASTWSAAEQGGLADLWVQPYVRKEGSVGVRAMLKSKSLKLTFLQQEKMVWQRDEALAYVQHAVLVDIPVPSPSHNELMDDEHIRLMNPIARLLKRTMTDALDLMQYVTTPPKAKSSERTQAAWDTEGVSLNHDLEPDRFGFKKVIVVITSPGVVAGIHSGTGEVVWQRYYEDAHLERVFLTHASATDGNLECIILAKCTGAGKNNSMVMYLQPLTGAELKKTERLPYKLVQAAMAPLVTKNHAQVVVGMDSEARVHVFPDTHESRQLVAGKSGKIYFYLTEMGSCVMKGYVLLASKGGRELVAEESWTVALPPSEAITALAPHNVHEAIRSAGRVLGNRGVLLKYINANSLAVATESVGGQADSKEVSSAPTIGAKEPCVRIYLIDTVTGAILHSVAHKDAKGPVNLVQTENTMVYNYWNNKKLRHEISVMELYENSKQEILTAGQMMMYNDSKTTYSSHGSQMDKPRVLSQTYIMPMGVKKFDVTQSMHGITTRNILVALANDQVLSLDRKFLDPRRPVGKPSPDDMEEMLVPYAPFLPIVPTAVLSYNHTVQQLRGFAVAPARIESTSLMLAIGVDLFLTRVAPAKAFDCLGEDFNYTSLILAVTLLASLSWVANWYANKSDLDKAWK